MRERIKQLKEKYKEQGGFTLIELMAVLGILALIVLIAVPAISGIMGSAQDDAHANTVEMIEKSAEMADVGGLEGDTTDTYTVKELIDGGFLDIESPYQSGDNLEITDEHIVEKDGAGYTFNETVPAG